MTVRDFALAAHEPKGLKICMRGTEYNMISNYTVWIKEVPVKEVRS